MNINLDKRGLMKSDAFHLALILVVAVFIVYFGSFVISISTSDLSKTNATIPEDLGRIYNFSINQSGEPTLNLTGVNITLPASFTFLSGSNSSTNLSGSAYVSVYFSNTSNQLSWNATALTNVIVLENTQVNGTGDGKNNSFFGFNATASTPGLYNITVRLIYNNTLTGPFNETNITIRVNDTTAPFNVNVTSNVSGHAWSLANVSGTVTVNVTALDNGNFTAGLREYDVQAVNFTVTNASGGINASYTVVSNVTGKYWNVSIVTTQFPDGIYNITVYSNDTLNNVNWTSFNVTFDNTKPTASVACSPATANTGDTETCTCSPSDVTSGVNSSATSITANPSTASTGTFTSTCNFADMAGNTATASTTYIVTHAVIASSGAGAVTSSASTTLAGIPGTSSVFPITGLTPSQPAVITNIDKSTGVSEINIQVNSAVASAQVTITPYSGGRPSAVSADAPLKTVYKYVQIKTDNSTLSSLNKATIKFQVEKSWVSSNGLTKDKVSFYKTEGGSSAWNELSSTFANEDATYYYYTTDVNSFSYFAVGGKATTPTTTTTGTTGGTKASPSTSSKSVWLWILGVAIVLAIIGWFVWKKRK